MQVAVRFGSGKHRPAPGPAGPRPAGQSRLRRRRARAAQHRRDQRGSSPAVRPISIWCWERAAWRCSAGRPAATCRRSSICWRPTQPIPATGRRPCSVTSTGWPRPMPSWPRRPAARCRGRSRCCCMTGIPDSRMPSEAQARQRTLGELRDWLEPQLRDGPLRVIVVGDFDPTRLIEEVGRTFGALPPRGAAESAKPPMLTLPASPEPIRLHLSGCPGRGAGTGLLADDRPNRRRYGDRTRSAC